MRAESLKRLFLVWIASLVVLPGLNGIFSRCGGAGCRVGRSDLSPNQLLQARAMTAPRSAARL
jgi:hypothetical protein